MAVGFLQTVVGSHFDHVALDSSSRRSISIVDVSTAVWFEKKLVDSLVLFIVGSDRFLTFSPEGKDSVVVWAESAYFFS